jgi:hypothetical protein
MVGRIDARPFLCAQDVDHVHHLRGLTVRFHPPASPAGSRQQMNAHLSAVIRIAQLAAVTAFCGAVTSTSYPQNQATIREPQLIQWIQYLAGQTLSCWTDT